jgi:hypothetical protein
MYSSANHLLYFRVRQIRILPSCLNPKAHMLLLRCIVLAVTVIALSPSSPPRLYRSRNYPSGTPAYGRHCDCFERTITPFLAVECGLGQDWMRLSSDCAHPLRICRFDVGGLRCVRKLALIFNLQHLGSILVYFLRVHRDGLSSPPQPYRSIRDAPTRLAAMAAANAAFGEDFHEAVLLLTSLYGPARLTMQSLESMVGHRRQKLSVY